MREIKFRAWNGERLRAVWTIGWIDGEMDLITTPKFSEPAEDCVLMQYTGLKDKNGKEIYEGDILKSVAYAINKEVTGIVKYNNDLAHFYLEVDSNKRIVFLGLINTEVIGNIYENPELLNENTTN